MEYLIVTYRSQTFKIYYTGGLFQYNNKLFTQIDAVSMGNPLAPTIENYLMGILEKNLFNTEDEKNPVLYFRYLDEIFCTFRKVVSFKI